MDTHSESTFVDLCDGNWHKIMFRNIQRKLSIVIDETIATGPYITTWKSKLALNKPTYFGGINDEIMRENPALMMYVDDEIHSFGGCMSDIYFNGVEINILTDIGEAYNTDLDGCPVGSNNFNFAAASNSGDGFESGDGSGSLLEFYEKNFFEDTQFSEKISLQPHSRRKLKTFCVDPKIDVLYEDYGFSYNDFNVNKFERYLYRVISSNAGGESRSTWQIMRSGEDAPGIVGTPYNEKNITGHIVQIEWRQPLHTYGFVVNYTIIASQNPDQGM